MDVGIGLVLHADEGFLRLVAPLVDAVDYLEVTPEALWRHRADGSVGPNAFHERMLAIGRRTGLPFVGHGIGFSLGGLGDDATRQARWLACIREDHAAFRFRWYTEHAGATVLGGLHLALPCPVPASRASAHVVRRRLRALRDVVGTAGVENTAHHFCLGSPLDEPAFLAAATDDVGLGVLLDLHNVHAMACNLGFDVAAYLERLPLERVVEIHLAGGGTSNGAWLPSRRTVILDAHDRAVPEAVWDLLAAVAPRCPNLRGVTLERMHGTLDASDVELLRNEIRRARRIVRGRCLAAPRRAAPGPPLVESTWSAELERAYARALCRQDAVAAVQRIADDRTCPAWLVAALRALDADGVRITRLLIAKLRFERLVSGSGAAARWFREDPRAFAAAFALYHRGEPPRDHTPAGEAHRFRAWCDAVAAGSPA